MGTVYSRRRVPSGGTEVHARIPLPMDESDAYKPDDDYSVFSIQWDLTPIVSTRQLLI